MNKRKFKRFIEEYAFEITTTVIFIIITLSFAGAVYKCSHNEHYINYGNKDYCFVTVHVDSGKHGNTYEGTILNSDYDRWTKGETGTIFIYSTTKENLGNIVSLRHVTSIINHGSEPNWLPINFWG